ncbi:DUF6214 family protein [Streptomyces sp. NPDC052114]|uniref:DUF6214 family protein n=1 Tax=unclassified Streptomyces TaxID=2593676 RepID=UPI0034161E4E
MRDSSYFDVSDHYQPDGAVTVWPGGESQGYGPAAPGDVLPPWCHVRLTFADGAALDVLAVAAQGHVPVDPPRAEPLLFLDGLVTRADKAERPPHDAWPVVAEQYAQGETDPPSSRPDAFSGSPSDGFDGSSREPVATRRARPALPRGNAGRRAVADTYRAAQDEGRDPVLAVMCATGRSRRKSLRLIAGARDAGYLTPRHHRR